MNPEPIEETAAADLLREYDVEIAYLFGSRARGDHGPASDADVGVLFAEGLDGRARFQRQLQLASRLCSVLEVPRVDVVVLDEAPPALRFRVIEQGRLLLCDNELRRIRFEARTMVEYIDTRRLRELCQRGLLDALAGEKK